MIVELNLTIHPTVKLSPDWLAAMYHADAELRRQEMAVAGQRFTVLVVRYQETLAASTFELCALLCVLFGVPFVAVSIPQIGCATNIGPNATEVAGFDPERFLHFDGEVNPALFPDVANSPRAANILH